MVSLFIDIIFLMVYGAGWEHIAAYCFSVWQSRDAAVIAKERSTITHGRQGIKLHRFVTYGLHQC